MLYAAKILTVIFILAGLTFRVSRGISLKFIAGEDLTRRCRVWYVLTAAAFLSPNVWILLAVCALVLFWAARRDSNPAALYIFLLWVIPPFKVRLLPGVFLFYADFRTVACLVVMLPSLWRAGSGAVNRGAGRVPGVALVNFAVWGFFLYTGLRYLKPEIAPGLLDESTTLNDLRRIGLAVICSVVPYLVISRSVGRGKPQILDMVASYCLACAVLSVLGMAEMLRHWMLYGEFASHFGQADSTTYLMRDGIVRARVSAGHPLMLGLVLAVAFGLAMALKDYLVRPVERIGVSCINWAGLIAAYSRGPWVGAVAVWVLQSIIRPHAARNLARMALLGAIALAGLMLTPLGQKQVASMAVFSGHQVVDEDVMYRQLLLHRSLEIWGQHMLLGEPRAILQMQDLRQGEGIIDFVNVYAALLVSGGLISVTLYLLFGLVALGLAWQWSRRWRRLDPPFSAIGAGLASGIGGMLLMLASQPADNYVLCAVVGIAVAYARVSHRELAGASRPFAGAG